jgi:TonB family protein
MVVLDACRDNPFLVSMVRSNAGRSVGRGLARVEPPRDTAVMYAAKDGAIAADGRAGTNSPFAAALSRRLTQPGLEISLLFRVVRDDVLRATGGGQEPYTYSSLSGEAFYFVPEGTAAQAIAPAVAPKLVPPPRVASPLPTPAFVKPSTSTKASAGQGMVALGSYCSFMRSQPDSAGQNQLVLLPEGEAWAATTANGGFMCYQSFARVYPTGARAAAARDAMRGLVPKLGGDRPAELQNARSLVTDRDYPERALRMEKQGDVTVLLSFDEFGLPSACQIASSSGYEDLDEHTCRVVRRRARVTPAIKGGSLQSSQFRIPIRWTLSN